MEDELVTGEAVAVEVRATPFGLRVAGGVIDFLVYGVGTLLAELLCLGILGLVGADDATLRSAEIVAAVLGLVGAPTLVESLTLGRSLGRLAVGARIVRDDGGPIAARHAFVRALLAIIEVFMTLGGLATIVALLSVRTKRLGDMVAGTYSRHERVPRVTPLAAAVPESLGGWTAIADVGRLPDALSRRIARFIRQSSGMAASSRDRLAAALLAEASPWVHPLPAAPAAEVLQAIAALRQRRETTALDRQAALMARLAPSLGNPHDFPDRG